MRRSPGPQSWPEPSHPAPHRSRKPQSWPRPSHPDGRDAAAESSHTEVAKTPDAESARPAWPPLGSPRVWQRVRDGAGSARVEVWTTPASPSPREGLIDLAGNAPEGLLEILAADSRYGAAATVTGVGSLVEAPGVGKARVVATYQGNFVTGAGDFSVAASAVWNMVMRVRSLPEQGFTLEGDVATIEFGREVRDLDRLVEGLFASKAPFRLWAVPRLVDNDKWYADAVDLHVGHPLRLHLSATRARVLLDPRTCGNTIARLLTNFQQHLDARSARLAPA